MKGFTPRNVTIQVTHLNVPKTQLARADKMQQRKLKGPFYTEEIDHGKSYHKDVSANSGAGTDRPHLKERRPHRCPGFSG